MVANLKMACVAAAFVLALAGMAQATTIDIANSSFESPNVFLTYGAYYSSAPSLADQGGSGWNFSGGASYATGISVIGKYSWYPQTSPDGGTQFMYSNGGTAYQTTGYTVHTGDVFTLKVDVGNSSSAYGGELFRAALYMITNPTATPTTTNVVGTGTVDSNGDYNGYARQAMNSWSDDQQHWKEFTITYTATAGDNGKTVGVWLDCQQNAAYFDDVRLSVSPEPATMALLAVGGVGALLRRKR